LLFRLIPSPETDIETYVVGYFGHLFNESERRARKHLASEWYLMRYEEMLSRGIAHERARGQNLPERLTSLIPEWRNGLSDDPEILRLVSGGWQAFWKRTAKRILDEQQAEIVFNNCPACGAIARTPKARQCRHCKHDWHGSGEISA
jgi:hypothetical protein